MGQDHKQIGEVSERTGLSLRTIRYYEEVGLVIPSARSHGGFRLYTESDIARLMVVKRMKPLDFTLEEMRDLLTTLDNLERDDVDAANREATLERLTAFESAAEERCRSLRAQLESAEEFAGDLRRELSRRGAVTES
ncbi:DNA-binding transcriptional MerR regulator [Isoptericola sp. CG 20/1183]|uniref:DNA-binding transcriptional MerR regulator n=1 Tax=Isoptericola halotolerans TaxID=300560 RepID=A0ABX5EKD7_9MICO|nr:MULTISPECIES: MerR family transcriptional regulator [Isoptericola]PRZ04201.1 DNA-binding transcriptional MerR regulator [Isoptericola sp. CG 20/1183]PRZ09974.1 DNA-binding transcriptional MerR regulator [Isoptericola halotolerans]